MNFKPLNSSNIHSVAYDPATQTMEVKFHGGGHYRYFDVSPKTHEGLLNAESAGKFFGAHVRGKHGHENVGAEKKVKP